jgi:hypothetical protein
MATLSDVLATSPYNAMTNAEAAAALHAPATLPTSMVDVSVGQVAALIPMSEANAWRTSATDVYVTAYEWFVARLSAGDGTIRGDVLVGNADTLLGAGIISQGTRDAVVALTVATWPKWREEGLPRLPRQGDIERARR